MTADVTITDVTGADAEPAGAAGEPTGPRILLFTGRFEVRASSAATLRLCRDLPGEGFRVSAVCADADRVPPNARHLPIREYRDFDRPLWGAVVLEGLRRDLRDEPPDLIHVQGPAVLPFGLWLARKLNRPCVLGVTAAPPIPPRLARLDGRVRRVIAISRAVAVELARRHRIAESRITVVPAGVDLPPEDGIPPVLEPGRAAVVGTAGPLEVPKGLPYFLGAAARLRRRWPDTQFLLSGAGPEEANLRRLAGDLGLAGAVTFAPNLMDFSASLRATDLFCLPSLHQGLGATMLEAMALARPVVASAVGGVEDVLTDGETGLLVSPGDSGRLAGRLGELLDDPDRARAIGRAGRRLAAEHYTAASMTAATAAVYREVLG